MATPMSAEKKEQKPEEDDNSLQLGVYLSWVKNELDSENACLELPFTMVLLISFSCLAYLHLHQDQVLAVEGSLRFDIEENANFAWSHNFGHKTIFDVNSIPDFYSWFRIGFLPLVVQHSWSYSEALPAAYLAANFSQPFDSAELPGQWRLAAYGANSRSVPVRNDYLRHSRILGGMRLRQERSEGSYEDCQLPAQVPEELWRPWLGKPCFPPERAYELAPEPSHAEAFGEPRRLEWLLPGQDSLDDLRAAAVDMEDGCAQLAAKGPGHVCLCKSCKEDSPSGQPWIDERTQRAEVAMLVYNSEYGLYSLVTVNFFFNRGGKIQKLLHVQSSWANDFDRPFLELVLMIACDLVWLLCLCYVLICEIGEIVKTLRSSKQAWYHSLWFYIGLWNTVDWISILCAVLLVIMYLRLRATTAVLNEEFVRMASSAPLTARTAVISEADHLFTLMENVCTDERVYRTTFILYPMVVMLRLFKSFDAQPRLAVVTRTLVSSSVDMTHFFIVFLSVYFCMVVNSILLFGQDVEEFATLHRATITCFQMMFGSWDYERMRKVGLPISAIWMWIFVLVISVLLLNMLLAILMDAYAEVKGCAVDSRTLFKQSSEILRRRREFQRGKRVRLTDVWAAFFRDIGDEEEMLGSSERMTIQRILERVPGMKIEQATRTFKQAKRALEEKTEVPFTQDSVKSSVDNLNARTRLIRDEAQHARRVLELHDESSKITAPGKASNEPRVRVVKAVRGVVEQLRAQLAITLQTEGQSFEGRQQELIAQHGDLLGCAKDAHGTFQELHAKLDDVVQTLQRHKQQQQQEQRQRQMSTVGGRRLGLAGPFAACVGPMQAPPSRMQH